MDITLYSTGCPQCIMVEKKLKDKGINYKLVSNKEAIMSLGFTKVPIINIDGEFISDILKINNFINNWGI